MQQSRPAPQAEATESSLFAGLSFPEVPTSLIVPRRAMVSDVPTAPATVVEENFYGTEMVNLEPGSIAGASQASAPPVVQAITQTNSLASLYAPAPAATRYPEISSITRGSSRSFPASAPVAVAAVPRAQLDADERVGLLSSQGAALSSAALDAEGANASLIHDLMMENARLADENARLSREKAALEHASAPVATPVTSLSRAVPDYHQPTIISSNSSAAVASGSSVGSLSAPAQGIRISGSTPPAQREGVKYVCCGACRQWLLSPRDASYVYCPQCRSINNCGAMPPASGQNRGELHETGTRAGPLLERPETWTLPPYISECFRGIFR